MKKIVALALAMVMLLGMVPVMAEDVAVSTISGNTETTEDVPATVTDTSGTGYIPGVAAVGMLGKALSDGKMAGVGFSFSLDYDEEKMTGDEADEAAKIRDALSSIRGSLLFGMTPAGFRVVLEGSVMPVDSKDMVNMEAALTFEDKGFSLETDLLPGKRLFFEYYTASLMATPADLADVVMKATHGDPESLRAVAAEITKMAAKCVKDQGQKADIAVPEGTAALLTGLGNSLGKWFNTLQVETKTVEDAGDGITAMNVLSVTGGSVIDLGVALLDGILADDSACEILDEVIAQLAPLMGEQGEAFKELNAVALCTLLKVSLLKSKSATDADQALFTLEFGNGDQALALRFGDTTGTKSVGCRISGLGTSEWKLSTDVVMPGMEMAGEKVFALTENGEIANGKTEMKNTQTGEVVTETETAVFEMQGDVPTGSLVTEINMMDFLRFGVRAELYTAEFDAEAYNAKEIVSALTAPEEELKQLVDLVPQTFKDAVKELRNSIPEEDKIAFADALRNLGPVINMMNAR